MTTRIKMHSPPKGTVMKEFDNEQRMILMIVAIICITVVACIVGGICVSKVL